MALLKSTMWTSISGSVGGTTFAKSAQGYYARARTVPVNPQSPQQSAVRGPLALLANRWTNVLTQPERDAWNLYASNVPVPGRDGTMQQISGQAHYLRSNALRLQATDALYAPLDDLPITASPIDVAPSTMDTGEVGAISLTSVAAGVVTAEFDDTLTAWVGAVGNFLFFFLGRPRSAGRSYFRGPWRLLGVVPGAVAPASSPAVLTAVAPCFVPAAGEKCRVSAVLCRADGRRSVRVYSGDVIAS